MSDQPYTDALKTAHSAQRVAQTEAVETLASLVGHYYQALTKEGVPHDLASDLVAELHAAQIDKIFGR